jgi:hypothetical protein
VTYQVVCVLILAFIIRCRAAGPSFRATSIIVVFPIPVVRRVLCYSFLLFILRVKFQFAIIVLFIGVFIGIGSWL